MRILYFSRDYTTHDHRFLRAMGQTEHEIFYLRLENSGVGTDDRPVPSDVQQVQWMGGGGSAKLVDSPRLLRDLRRVIRTHQPDLIQAGPVQRSAFLTALAGFKPLVTMSWGYDLLHDVNRGRLWKWATSFTLKRSGAFVGDCNTIRTLAIQYGMDPQRIVTFPWGVNIEHFSPDGGRSGQGSTTHSLRERWGWDRDCFALLSTRSWSPIYGVTDLVRAFVRAARRHPELRLLMLGGGPLSNTIKSIVHRAGMIDRVHFPGQVSQKDLPTYYRAADLYISTSYSDGTSISLLEALACGTPVLLTDIPGNQEWIVPGEQGWLFAAGDVRGLEEAVLHAVENRDKLADMGKAARKLAEARANWQNNFPQLFEAWKMAVQHSN